MHSWHAFNKVLELLFLTSDFEIFQLQHAKMLCWIELWCPRRSFGCIVILKKPVRDYLSFEIVSNNTQECSGG